MKNTHIALVLLSTLSLMTAPIMAQSQLDSASQEALQKTNDLLKNKQEREAYIKTDSKAQAADAYVKKVGGSKQGTEDIYALSAKVFQKLVQKYNGDPEKMKEVLERAQKDPAGFANSEFSAEELKALRELSSKMPLQAPAK